MGRQSEPMTITHFSHHHPLHLTNPHPSLICSCCKQTLQSEPFYTCNAPSCTTTFSLHLKCSQLPQTITHPFHHHHTLSLLPNSHNSNRHFTCNACGNHGDGFSYTCKDCGVSVSIHVMCATLPLQLTNRSHTHPLGLVYVSPYGNNGFSCDVCGGIGSKCWLYRCGLCGFDAHLACATTMPNNTPVVARDGNLLLNQTDENTRNQLIVQALMALSGGRGGTNVNNQILQAMMGGRGDGIQGLLNGSNGGFGGLDLSSVLGSNGGFGGLDLSSILGSNGGFGGLDLSSVLGNVGGFGGLGDLGLGGFGF